MPDPIVVTVSHRLGRDGARRRIDESLTQIRRQLAAFTSSLDTAWKGDRLEFSLVAMRQQIAGHLDVEESLVRIVVELPLLLRMLAGPIVRRVQGEAALLLDKPRV